MAAVSGNKDDGYVFTCPVDDGQCQGFTSSGWPTKSAAETRGAEHLAEHESGKAMPELQDSKAAS